MGNASSTEILQTPLCPLAQPVAAVNAKHCVTTPVTLHLREKARTPSGDDFAIHDVHSGMKRFRIDGSSFSLSDHKALVDATSNHPIAHMRNVHFTFMKEFSICADPQGCRELFVIKSKLHMVDSELDVQFCNVVNGRPARVGMCGNWRTRAAMIWIDQGYGHQMPVARIYRPSTARGYLLGAQDYYVDVAPNMDQALVVLICVALDECKKD